MAVVVIARGPWSIDTATITSTTRTADGGVIVIAAGVAYLLTVAEAITLSVTIPQIPPIVAAGAQANALLPNTNIAVLGVESVTGKLVVIAWGIATTSAGIIAQIGAAALYADGSTYYSCLSGGGLFFQKVNGVWAKLNVTGAGIYSALLSQAAGAAPLATVLENTLSAAIVWARTSAGLYTGTLVAAFTAAKTQIFIGSNAAILPATTFDVIQSQRTSADVVTIQTSLVTLSAGPPPTGVATDSILSETAIRIVVFP